MNATCPHCEEPIVWGDMVSPSTLDGKLVHCECMFRMVCGSVTHVRQTCSCYGGTDTDLDPPNLTKRQAAKAALDEYRNQRN
jgi:hypothetical protein